MKKIVLIVVFAISSLFTLSAQPLLRRPHYNIASERLLYTIGYAHLDTEWNWDYPITINQYLLNTMEGNFRLFDKYPDYVFNFTGSRRYEMMKEYYPELFKKVKDYVEQGRWYVSGSSVDEGEVNISSSESVMRQILYGNLFFRKTFNRESYDYMLPDCFGFVATMPSIWSHAGLLGFSTQKLLAQHSANGIPFNIGLWEGPDGRSVIAALNATRYVGQVVPRLDKDSTWDERLQDDKNKYGLSFDYRYYGVGDQGGSPREADVINATGSLNNSDSKFKVLLTSSDQMFRDITPEIKSKLPTYSGDLLLVEHSAGSLTSESFMKRANRKNEALAYSAEQAAVIAEWLGGASYPVDKLNDSWNLVLGGQFHDILPGTSIPKAYEYAWNDEFIAMNGFSEVLKNSVRAISHDLNTMVKGRPVIVYNSVPVDREDVVTAEISYPKLPANVSVFDENDRELPSQIISSSGNKLTIIFLAKMPPAGLTVFDIRETSSKPAASTLKISSKELENEYYKVELDSNGDIAGIFDKKTKREVLSKPATLDFQQERPAQWPSWNMDWNDRKNPPIDYMNKDVEFNIVEQGPVRVALSVTRRGLDSEITQIISLSAGEPGKVIEVNNDIDWQSKEVSLKAAFPTTVINEFATYGLNTAAIQRTTNNDVKYEVPGRQWIDITDRSNSYGVSILEDCKYGSDKPDNSTLRLTLMYTPRAANFVYQGSQDWGIHRVRYGIYPHVGDWVYAGTPWEGHFINNPPIAFETSKHQGKLGRKISFIKMNTAQIDIMAFKKAEESDYYIVRVNELYGKDAKRVSLSFPGRIVDAYEVNGQEKKIGPADFTNGTLNFDMTRFLIRSFAVRFENPSLEDTRPVQSQVDLPYNEDGFSFDNNRSDGNIINGMTIPAEMIPGEIVSEDIRFRIGSTIDRKKNMLSANGQKIILPSGDFNKLYILAAGTEDSRGTIKAGSQSVPIDFQNWTGYIGQHYNRMLYFNNTKVASITKAFTKRDNIAWYSSHRHIPEGNDAYQYCYLFKYEVNITKGTRSITLPKNEKIKIFAVTVTNDKNEGIVPLQYLYDDFRNDKPLVMRNKEYVTPDLKPLSCVQRPIFRQDIDVSQLRLVKDALRNIGADTLILRKPQSMTDYADKNSGNGITAAYFATGKSAEGKIFNNEKIDISDIFDSRPDISKESVLLDNGEGRIVIDLGKQVTIKEINIFFSRQKNMSSPLFSIWNSIGNSGTVGDPLANGWKYVGSYTGFTARGISPSGTSMEISDGLSTRFLMFINEGIWHGTDYFKHIDIITK